MNGADKCRFSCPQDLKESTHIGVEEFIVSNEEKSGNTVCIVNTLKYRINMYSYRNGRWVDIHDKICLQY